MAMAQVFNGDMGGIRDRMPDACFPKQEKREVENGIPRDPSSCRAEDSSQGQSLSHPQENGFLSSREEQDLEKANDDCLMTPRKKRGRRKLERPTKCKILAIFIWGFCLVFSWGLLSFDQSCVAPGRKNPRRVTSTRCWVMNCKWMSDQIGRLMLPGLVTLGSKRCLHAAAQTSLQSKSVMMISTVNIYARHSMQNVMHAICHLFCLSLGYQMLSVCRSSWHLKAQRAPYDKNEIANVMKKERNNYQIM